MLGLSGSLLGDLLRGGLLAAQGGEDLFWGQALGRSQFDLLSYASSGLVQRATLME